MCLVILRDRDYSIRQREFLSYVLGLDWTVHDNLMANVQFFQNVIFNAPGALVGESVENAVSLFLLSDFLHETSTLNCWCCTASILATC